MVRIQLNTIAQILWNETVGISIDNKIKNVAIDKIFYVTER